MVMVFTMGTIFIGAIFLMGDCCNNLWGSLERRLGPVLMRLAPALYVRGWRTELLPTAFTLSIQG